MQNKNIKLGLLRSQKILVGQTLLPSQLEETNWLNGQEKSKL